MGCLTLTKNNDKNKNAYIYNEDNENGNLGQNRIAKKRSKLSTEPKPIEYPALSDHRLQQLSQQKSNVSARSKVQISSSSVLSEADIIKSNSNLSNNRQSTIPYPPQQKQYEQIYIKKTNSREVSQLSDNHDKSIQNQNNPHFYSDTLTDLMGSDIKEDQQPKHQPLEVVDEVSDAENSHFRKKNLPELSIDKSHVIQKCYICDQAINRQEKCYLTCKHFYHEDCICDYLGSGHKCPLCRKFSKNQLYPKV